VSIALPSPFTKLPVSFHFHFSLSLSDTCFPSLPLFITYPLHDLSMNDLRGSTLKTDTLLLSLVALLAHLFLSQSQEIETLFSIHRSCCFSCAMIPVVFILKGNRRRCLPVQRSNCEDQANLSFPSTRFDLSSEWPLERSRLRQLLNNGF